MLRVVERAAQNVLCTYCVCVCVSLFLTSFLTSPHTLNTKSLIVSSPGLRLTTVVFSFQMIVRVFADDVGEDEPLVTDVPVTPDTTCRDVIECCRDPGDEHCALVETWGPGHGEFCGYS